MERGGGPRPSALTPLRAVGTPLQEARVVYVYCTVRRRHSWSRPFDTSGTPVHHDVGKEQVFPPYMCVCLSSVAQVNCFCLKKQNVLTRLFVVT